jgi:phage shock protein PspC (stress-responsive transcriptional regulator)
MQGNILTFSTETNTGIITGAGNKRYTFSADDWKEKCPVISRVNVDFVAIEDAATEIYCTDTEALQDELEKVAAQKAAEIVLAESIKQKENIDKLEKTYSGLYRSSDQALWKGVCAGLAHKTGIPVFWYRISPLAILITALITRNNNGIGAGFYISPPLAVIIFYFYASKKWKCLETKNVYSVGADKFAEKINSSANVFNTLAGGTSGDKLANRQTNKNQYINEAKTEPQRVLSNVLACAHCGASTSVSSQTTLSRCPSCGGYTRITYNNDGTIFSANS